MTRVEEISRQHRIQVEVLLTAFTHIDKERQQKMKQKNRRKELSYMVKIFADTILTYLITVKKFLP